MMIRLYILIIRLLQFKLFSIRKKLQKWLKNLNLHPNRSYHRL